MPLLPNHKEEHRHVRTGWKLQGQQDYSIKTLSEKTGIVKLLSPQQPIGNLKSYVHICKYFNCSVWLVVFFISFLSFLEICM